MDLETIFTLGIIFMVCMLISLILSIWKGE